MKKLFRRIRFWLRTFPRGYFLTRKMIKCSRLQALKFSFVMTQIGWLVTGDLTPEQLKVFQEEFQNSNKI
jgi:hypothetical protein